METEFKNLDRVVSNEMNGTVWKVSAEAVHVKWDGHPCAFSKFFFNPTHHMQSNINELTIKQMKKIYVASSWRNPYQPEVVKQLRALGHEVYDFRNPGVGQKGFAWSEIDPDWQDWTPEQYVEILSNPIAERGFKSDFDAMKWADTCVMVLPCGRSANTEAGWMKGAGKEVHVLMPIPQEPELMYKIYDSVMIDFDQLSDI